MFWLIVIVPSPTTHFPPHHRLRLLSVTALIAVLAGLVLATASDARPVRVVASPTLTMARAVQDSLTPADYRNAYSLPRTGAAHQKIAVVSAYDDPAVQGDLHDYTTRFGIPACTVANGCFGELNQQGQASPLPPKDPTGATFSAESSIGTEVARGVCQSCSILLVEASSADKSDLSAAVRTAIDAGATVVVTAFNTGEAADDPQYAADYASSRAVVVAASGDGGYSQLLEFPASLPDVLAVGGTQLSLSAGGQRVGETAWEATTSGCSLYEAAPVWQAPFARSVGCGSERADADLAAAATPGALVHVQDAGPPCGNTWCEADGTSVAAPIIAGTIGLAGSDGSGEARMLYQHFTSDPSAFHDITSGINGSCGKPICRSRRGYDGPTGLGTPDGLAAFLRDGGVVDSRRPGVTIASPSRALRVTGRWTTALTLRNDNPFALTGSIALQRRLRVDGRLTTVTFATHGFAVGPLASASIQLTIAGARRQLLSQLRSAQVTVAVKLRGPAGRAVTTSRSRRLVVSEP